MSGVALASSLHFVSRAVILILLCRYDKDFAKCELPLKHANSTADLKEMRKIGWNTMLVKVMGWWAFDIFT